MAKRSIGEKWTFFPHGKAGLRSDICEYMPSKLRCHVSSVHVALLLRTRSGSEVQRPSFRKAGEPVRILAT
jgi:hypothetical protein